MSKLLLAAAVVAAAGTAATAQTVTLNASVPAASLVAGSDIGTFRYRFHNNNTDMVTFSGPGTTTIIGQQNLGDRAQLNGVAYAFSIEFDSTLNRFTFGMDAPSNPPADGSIVWNVGGAPAAFNLITLNARANGNSTQTMNLSNVNFTVLSGSATTSGAAFGVSAANSAAAGYILSSANLGTFSWRVTGTMTGAFTNSSFSTETLSSNIVLSSATIVPLPPAAWAGLGMIGAMGGAAALRRRRLARA